MRRNALVAMGGWNYANQEILSFVTWLRGTRQAQFRSQRPVRIMGCDCQSMDGPKAELLRRLQEFAPTGELQQDAADEAAALVTALPTDRDLGQFVELILREMDVQAPEESRMADIKAWQAEFVASVSVSVDCAFGRLQNIGLALPESVSRDDRFFSSGAGASSNKSSSSIPPVMRCKRETSSWRKTFCNRADAEDCSRHQETPAVAVHVLPPEPGYATHQSSVRSILEGQITRSCNIGSRYRKATSWPTF